MGAPKSYRLIEEVNNRMVYRFGRFVIPQELALEIKDYFNPKPPRARISQYRRFTDKEVKDLRFKYKVQGNTLAELAKEYGVSRTTVWRIANGFSYKVEKKS